MTSAPIRLRKIPARAICAMLIRLLPKTMAFGGVATGIMNAHEADIVAGIIRTSGMRARDHGHSRQDWQDHLGGRGVACQFREESKRQADHKDQQEGG